MGKISDQEARLFLVAAVTLASTTWTLAFNLGAFGVVFFEQVFFVWVASLVIYLAGFFLPEEHYPVSWNGRLILAIPTLWLLLRFLVDSAPIGSFTNLLLLLMGVGIYLISLPYALYIIGRVTNPDLFEIRNRQLIIGLVFIIVIVGLVGFWIGRNNALFLSCRDFVISGNDAPPGCAQ